VRVPDVGVGDREYVIGEGGVEQALLEVQAQMATEQRPQLRPHPRGDAPAGNMCVHIVSATRPWSLLTPLIREDERMARTVMLKTPSPPALRPRSTNGATPPGIPAPHASA